MDGLRHIIHSLLDAFRPLPPPALHGMRLGPEGNPDNPLMLQFFTWDCKHDTMSWWKHLGHEMPQLAKMGFTQVWLPPPNKATAKEGRGYDAYDLWDLGEFDQKGTVPTRWGTKQELLQAINVANQHGIDILIDGVLNHKLGGDRVETFPAIPVDPDNRLKDLGAERNIEGWTAFDFSGRAGQYSSFQWTQEHFTGLDWDHRTQSQGVYRITGEGHEGWSRHVDRELGNYDYLLGVDIDHRHPGVREDLLTWGPWVLEATGATGFRLDAVKHMDRRFLLDFITTTRKRSGRPNMFVVAELWTANFKLIKPYIRAFKGQTAFFDVPLHSNFHRASEEGSQYDLRKIFSNTIAMKRPGDAVTFVDNHDTVDGQSLQSWVGNNFKIQAYALILLRPEGYPCVFYGDLYPNQCYDEAVASRLRLLIDARRLFAYGRTDDYFQERNCIGFVRRGDSEHPGCAVLISNQGSVQRFVTSYIFTTC